MATITRVSGGFKNDALSLKITSGSLIEWTDSRGVGNWIVVEANGTLEGQCSFGGGLGDVKLISEDKVFVGQALIKHAQITPMSTRFDLLGTDDLVRQRLEP